MAGRGPIPSGGKKRAEHPRAVVLELHQGGRDTSSAGVDVVEVPPMPPAPEGGWSQRAVDVWNAVWRSPHPPEFIPALHRWIVEKLVELEHLAHTAESHSAKVSLSAEARQLYQHLIITPAELRRSKIEVKRPAVTQAATGTTGRRRKDPRARS